MKLNKAQISIFILIAIMIIFLLIFLISFDSSKKVEKIDNVKDMTYADTDSKVLNLKDNVDFCLDKGLRKAVVIAGARGGLIYANDDENYYPGVLPNGIYKSTFLTNIGVTSSYLSQRTLLYTKDWTYIPPIENSVGTKFNHTLKEDMERFIFNDFLDCIDIESIEQRGYDVSYESFSGKIISNFGSGNIVVAGVIGRVNDTVKLDIGNKIYFGKITGIDDNLKITKVKFSDTSISLPASFESTNVVNLNSSVSLNITFQDEVINAKINFPISISKGNFSTYFKNSEVSINVRLKQLIKFSSSMMTYKYNNNHSLNLTNVDVLNKFIKGEIGSGVPYWKNTGNKNFEIIKTVLNDSDEYRAEVYTILDYDSKILGEPYVFNFGYENRAPVMNISFLGGYSSKLENNTVLFVTSKNNPMTFNLRDITKDPQVIDNLPWNKGYNRYWYQEQHYLGSDAKFDLYENGTLDFIGYSERIYAYDIVVTDGETKASYVFKFVVGLPDNTNNKAAISCFEFQPFGSPFFPIDNRLKKIFNYTDLDGVSQVYVFTNKIKSENGKMNTLLNQGSAENILILSPGCIFDISLYDVSCSINDGSEPCSIDSVTGEILISSFYDNYDSSFNPIKKVSVRVMQKGTLNDVVAPYNITVFMAPCLGFAQDDSYFNFMKDSGFYGTFDGSCCSVNPASLDERNPLAFLSATQILSSGENAANPHMYFTYGPDISSLSGYSVDYTHELIWKEKKHLGSAPVSSEITSMYKGKVVAECRGYFPNALDNIVSIDNLGGSTINSDVRAYTVSGSSGILQINMPGATNYFPVVPASIPVSLTLSDSTKMCEFTAFENESELKLVLNMPTGIAGTQPFGMPMVSGLISAPGNEVIYKGSTDSNHMVLCDPRWYGKESLSSIWVLGSSIGIFGKGGAASTIEVSKGFCSVNPNPTGGYLCEGQVGSANYAIKSDEVLTCKDYYVNFASCSTSSTTCNILSNFALNSWVCGSYIGSCSGGCAECGSGDPVVNNAYCSGTSYNCIIPSSVSCTSCYEKILKSPPTPATLQC